MSSGDCPFSPGPGADDELLEMEPSSPQTLLDYLRKQTAVAPQSTGRRLRRHERLKCDAPFVFEATAGPEGPVLMRDSAILQDISAGGAAFLCSHELTRGAHVRMIFEAFGAAAPPCAIVRYCTHLPGTRQYRIGVEFIAPPTN